MEGGSGFSSGGSMFFVGVSIDPFLPVFENGGFEFTAGSSFEE